MLQHELQGRVKSGLWGSPQGLAVGLRGLFEPPERLECRSPPHMAPTANRLEGHRLAGPSKGLLGVPELQVALSKVAEDLCRRLRQQGGRLPEEVHGRSEVAAPPRALPGAPQPRELEELVPAPGPTSGPAPGPVPGPWPCHPQPQRLQSSSGLGLVLRETKGKADKPRSYGGASSRPWSHAGLPHCLRDCRRQAPPPPELAVRTPPLQAPQPPAAPRGPPLGDQHHPPPRREPHLKLRPRVRRPEFARELPPAGATGRGPPARRSHSSAAPACPSALSTGENVPRERRAVGGGEMADRMVTVEEARSEALERCRGGRGLRVGLSGAGGLAEALGRVLREGVRAAAPVPAFRAAIKDGFAVVAADPPGLPRRVVGASRAGPPTPGLQVESGEAAYITTGAPVPEGADAVVMVENCSREAGGAPFGRGDAVPGAGEHVHLVGPACSPGQEIREVGSDVGAGEMVLERGERLGPAEVGLLATIGAQSVDVSRRPLVAVLSTGDEVVDGFSGVEPGLGQIRDANRPMLLAAASAAGANILDLGIAGDEEGSLEKAFAAAASAGADVLLTSGGVSMGDKDLLKGTLERLGRIHYGKVLMKPGKPLTFATLPREAAEGPPDELLVFGLPGNPVSSAVTFYLVVLPCLRALAGWRESELRRVDAVLEEELRLDPARPEFHRAVLRWAPGEGAAGGTFLASSTGGQISSRLLSMRSANALLTLPQRSGSLPAGAVVPALLIGDVAGMPQAPSTPTAC